MKILPKKSDIDKAKSDERKRLIDDGLSLATKVDKLRELKAQEERNLHEYKSSAIQSVQSEIDSTIGELNRLKIAVKKARNERQELIKPLDEEWVALNRAKEEFDEESKFLDQKDTELKMMALNIKDEWEELQKSNQKLQSYAEEIKQAKQDTFNFKAMAKREFELRYSEHIRQSEEYEKEMSKMSAMQRQYEVATKTAKLETKKAKELQYELKMKLSQEEFKERQYANN